MKRIELENPFGITEKDVNDPLYGDYLAVFMSREETPIAGSELTINSRPYVVLDVQSLLSAHTTVYVVRKERFQGILGDGMEEVIDRWINGTV